MTLHKGAGPTLWSDGIHFVRRATAKDRHKLRFVALAHKGTASTLNRHTATQEQAIDVARITTAHWLAAHPADAAFLTAKREEPTLPVSDARSGEASSKVGLAPFATTLFDCVYANPVAQVWRCVLWPADVKPVGRRKAGGKPPEQTPVPHVVGDFAVMKWEEPVRTPDGTVAVFPTWGAAEEVAANLYADEPEENTISWVFGSPRVAATPRVDILFEPDANGEKKPFSLWLPEYVKPVFVDTTRPTMTRQGINPANIKTDVQLRIDLEAARARARIEDRQPALEDKILRFRSIWAAMEEAKRREKMLRGETVR